MRILVVEDEKKVAKALRDGLEQTFGSEYETSAPPSRAGYRG